MKRFIREDITDLPFSLHDVYISRIRIRRMKDGSARMWIKLKEGYYGRDDRIVPGNLLFEGVDTDYSSISIITVKARKYERIRGRRYSVITFCKKFRDVDMEIIDETYGFHQTKLSGYMYIKNKIKEFTIDLYHTGNMVYVNKEKETLQT